MKKMIFSSMLAIGMIAAASLMNGCSKDSSNDESPTPSIDLGAKINQEAAKHGYMALKTETAIGEKIHLDIDADTADRDKVWIDLNNDGEQQPNEKLATFDEWQEYVLEAQTITTYGKVKTFSCMENKVTALDVSKNTALNYLNVSVNQIKKAAMNTLLSALPKRNTSDRAQIRIRNTTNTNEGNELPDAAYIQNAKDKNWKVVY